MNDVSELRLDQSKPLAGLEIKFLRGPDGQEQFGWQVLPPVPMMTMTGCIVRVQGYLSTGIFVHDWQATSDNKVSMLWDDGTKRFQILIDPSIPTDSLVGFLELVKTTLVATQMVQMQQQQRTQMARPANGRLFGPDGQLWDRR